MAQLSRVAAGLALLALAGAATAHFEQPAPVPDPVRLNNLGVAYMNQQRLEDALKLFEQAYALDPKLPVARLNQGIALLHLQRFPAARTAFEDAGRHEPTRTRAWYNLGLLHKNLGEAEQALAAFQEAARLDPADADTHYFLGQIQSQLERYQPAIVAFRQALALDRFHVSAEFGLARAYQRVGESARAREHLARFQHLTQERLGAPLSLAYGEQGRYSLAESVLSGAGAVPPAIPVRFVAATAEAGLRLEQAAANQPEAGSLASFLGPGVCFLDYDGDGRPDLFLAGPGALFRNAGGGRFEERTRAAKLELRGDMLGCTAGDFDNDGWTDLAVSFFGRVALYRNQGDATFRDVTASAGIRVEGFPLGLTFFDYDHDGDLDLYVARFIDFPWRGLREAFDFPFDAAPANLLWRNNGNGTFADRTEATGLAGLAPSVAAVATDFNNDRAVDLVVTGWRKTPVVFANPREGAFRPVEPWAAPLPAPSAGVAVFDFNKDGWMDLAFTHWGRPGLSLWRNAEGKRFEPVPLPALGWQRGWGLAALDYDNDGWLDLAAVGEAAEAAEIRLLRNRGTAGFEDATAVTGLAGLRLAHPRALVTADLDADGDTDLLVTQNRGPVELLRNDGGSENGWLRLALTGLADNKSAVGTKVEVFAGLLWQKWEVQAGSGYLGQNALEVVAGLGSERGAETLRLLWPTGVLQDEVQLAARARQAIREIDRRGSSCPILFAWNGSRYEFITDMIGAGVVGHWVGPGERNLSDPTEYVKIEARQVAPRRERLAFRLIEPMEEVVYLDQVRLLAVDHPADVEVYPNEYFAGRPPFPEFKAIASRAARPPRAARDDRGRDVRAELARRDRRHVAGFDLLPFKGFARLHALELDLGEAEASGPLRLLIDGFIDYISANSVYAAHQAGVRPVLPYLEALDASGGWVRVADNLGFPAGLARTMVADLTGRLPAGTRRIRLMTNLQIYWDRIRLDTTPAGVPLRLSEVPLADAMLGFHGYPRAVEGNPPGDLTYIYEEVSLSGPYARHAGAYTNYGDVGGLLAAADDQFVIFGSGEEVAVEFDPSSLPPLPAGWTRDYFFFADGFDKDMDFYEAYAQTVEPLPFHSMTRYPYAPAENYPEDDSHLNYRVERNVRHLAGRPSSSFRFVYRPEKDR